ncbi:Fumarylacetoacetate hydrolase family protein [Rhodococcus wratislaviensis]|uniref:Fumarylacetoacetate hydrolase family protein n=1 Tax=Rhodococcus wratislaviensis TaxID=44752 RepID=A0A402C036_RHOWR|nr:fumarylacetoacetate hydrolase family protein [Rhodococcus wratislaviensis]GCE36956.1 Fumarylacetoacetate hydrolase family protein [Rhodococcus wratislaviensis]
MRLCTVRLSDGGTNAAALNSDRWIRLPFSDVGALLREDHWRQRVQDVIAAGGQDVDSETITTALAPVIAEPGKIVCCGHNYRAHIAEMGRPEPAFPTLFAKFADTLTGAFDEISLPNEAEQLDWEAELAVVVGATLVRATEAECRRAIAGYTVANDLSVRSWQRRTTQWLQGKAFDATTPLGPVMVTADECDPSDGLRVTCTVNGQEQQRGSTDDLLFDPIALLAYISTFTTLRPGDIVLTGTPGGVGAGSTPPRFLGDGAVVETEIEGIGMQRNVIRIQSNELTSSAS